jgi:peptidoglycan/LPS O-acetylase OafA/YrhL
MTLSRRRTSSRPEASEESNLFRFPGESGFPALRPEKVIRAEAGGRKGILSVPFRAKPDFLPSGRRNSSTREAGSLAAGASASFSVTVKTAQTTAQIASRSPVRFAGTSLLSLSAMFALFRLRRRAWSLGLTVCLLAVCALTLVGCGVGTTTAATPTPTPAALTAAGTYTLTVTANAGATSSTQKLTLTVQ